MIPKRPKAVIFTFLSLRKSAPAQIPSAVDAPVLDGNAYALSSGRAKESTSGPGFLYVNVLKQSAFGLELPIVVI